MAKKDVTIESIASLLGIHRNSVANKINGRCSFYIEEAMRIRDAFFPEEKLEELFQKEEKRLDGIQKAASASSLTAHV